MLIQFAKKRIISHDKKNDTSKNSLNLINNERGSQKESVNSETTASSNLSVKPFDGSDALDSLPPIKNYFAKKNILVPIEKKESNVDFNLIEEEDYYKTPTPNYFRKILNICPIIEVIGYIKDHRFHFKEHWIQSKIHDPERLKDELKGLVEMEFFFGSLFLGVISSIYFTVLDDEVSNQFMNLEMNKLGFWISIVGAYSVMLCMFFTVGAYILLILMQPVSVNNFEVFIKSESQQRYMHFISCTLICTFYLTVIFLILSLLQKLSNSILHFLMIVGPFIILFSYAIPLIALGSNLSIVSGCYGEGSIINSNGAIYNSVESERILYWKCIKELNNNKKSSFANSLIIESGSCDFYAEHATKHIKYFEDKDNENESNENSSIDENFELDEKKKGMKFRSRSVSISKFKARSNTLLLLNKFKKKILDNSKVGVDMTNVVKLNEDK